ncbi:MAG: hypothetical protein JWM86_207 [Thermoleophilia bacterium]|nr:hypothetical protein [Thermoleophilia bacterium]
MQMRRATSLVLLATSLVMAACGGAEGGADTPASTGSTNATSTKDLSGATGAGAKVRLVQVGQFEQPIQAVAVPGTDLVAVAEKGGRVRLVSGLACSAADNCPAKPVTDGVTVIDISGSVSSGSEQGLLGIAFHPKWPDDPRLFIDYTDRDGDTRIEAWTLESTANGARKLQELLRIEQPYENHNGGHLAFGPDGLLYAATGDGGSGGDPEDRAQKPDELLGKLLRLDVDAGGERGFAPAPGNVKGGAREVWAVGLRNPWRFSFDSSTGDLWIGDVGQDSFEEIDALPRAALEPGTTPNFGWRIREGFDEFDDSGTTGPGRRIEPLLDYGREDGCSVTGGVVYRGALAPRLVGAYVFADFCSRDLRIVDGAADLVAAAHRRGAVKWRTAKGVDAMASISEVQRGELLVVSLGGGIHQVLPA